MPSVEKDKDSPISTLLSNRVSQSADAVTWVLSATLVIVFSIVDENTAAVCQFHSSGHEVSVALQTSLNNTGMTVSTFGKSPIS